MEIVKINPRSKKVVNYATFSVDSDSSDDEFVGVPKSAVIAAVQPPAAQRPTKFSKLKLGAKSAESGGGNTKLNLKTDDNFTRLKPTQPPPEIDLTIIPEPDLVIHSLSSQETELASSCECLSSQEFSVEASPQATTAQLNASSGSDSDIILPSRAYFQERNKRRILDDDSSMERKKSRIEPDAVEEVKVVVESFTESSKKNISPSRDRDKEIQPAVINLKPSCERYEIECESNSVEISTESQKKEEKAQPVKDPTCQLKEKESHTEERLPPPAELGKSPPNTTKTNKKSETTKPVVVPQIASLLISSAKPDPQPLPSKKGRNPLPSKVNKPELKKGRKENNSAAPAPIPQIPKEPSPLPDVPSVPSTTAVFTKPSVHLASTNLVKKPAAGRIPAWNPPGKANGASSPVVGSSPVIGLRLGLSRNRRAIKPLHPDVKLK